MADLNPEQFGGESKLTDYGIKTVPAWAEKHIRKTHHDVWVGKHQDVPMSKIRAGQHYVDTDRVHDIAKRGLNDPREADVGEVQGTKLPSGEVMLNDGHHRTAAAALNGAQFQRVLIGSKYLPRKGAR